MPSTTTGLVVVRAGCSSKRNGPTTGMCAMKSKRLIPTPKATLKTTTKSAMTSVDLNPPPFLPTPCSSRNENLARRILHLDSSARRTPACTMPGGGANGERSQVEQRVMDGAEPFHFEGNGTGVLVSHGFTGTTQSVRPLGGALAGVGVRATRSGLCASGAAMD